MKFSKFDVNMWKFLMCNLCRFQNDSPRVAGVNFFKWWWKYMECFFRSDNQKDFLYVWSYNICISNMLTRSSERIFYPMRITSFINIIPSNSTWKLIFIHNRAQKIACTNIILCTMRVYKNNLHIFNTLLKI